MIPHVEGLSAELESPPLVNGDGFEEAHVPV